MVIPIDFKYLPLQKTPGEVGGFALLFRSSEDATQAINEFSENSETSAFFFETSSDNKYNLTVSTKNFIYQTEIGSIEQSDIHRLENALKNYRSYFVVIGYTDKEDNKQILPPLVFTLFKSQFAVNDRIVHGVNKHPWPRELFDTDKNIFLI